jgi:polar amino acid transport system substrate-binding protein
MRIKFGILLLLVFALVVAACGDDDATTTTAAPATTAAPTTTEAVDECAVENLNLVTAGTLTLATSEPAYPPWMIDDDPTNKQGFEGAVAYAIANQMGFTDAQVEWVRVDFYETISVGPKNFDFNIQQYSITAEREEVVDFSDGYYTVQQALVAYADSAVTAANTAADLQGYKLGAAIGTTSFDYIEEVIQPSTPAAAYDDNPATKAALDAGQIDAVVYDLPTAFYITAVEIPEASIVGVLEAPGGAPEEFGLLFEEGNSLVGCVNQALAALEADGTLAALEAEWLIGANDFKVITP